MTAGRRFLTSSVLALTIPVFAASDAVAGPYWVVENTSNNVYTIDVNTATATLVGNAGVDINFGGLGFAPNGTLYAWNTLGNNLSTVNQTTGAFTLVGPGTVFGADTFDINPLTGEAMAWSVNGDIYDVNLATGATTLRTTTTEQGIASAFGTDGTYYQLDRNANELNRINTTTGAVTLIGNVGFDATGTNLGFNPADGFLYTVQIADGNFPLWRINATTGAATFVGNITGMGNNPSQQVTMGTFNVAAAVPEPASLALLGLGMAGLAIRRRKA